MLILELADTPTEIRRSILHWLLAIREPAHQGLVRRLLRTTSYWVYDPAFDAFGPGKFVGYHRMWADTYLYLGREGAAGVSFDGHTSRTSIERVLTRSFAPAADLSDRFARWADGVQSGVLAGLKSSKWKFLRIPDSQLLQSEPRPLLGSWGELMEESFHLQGEPFYTEWERAGDLPILSLFLRLPEGDPVRLWSLQRGEGSLAARTYLRWSKPSEDVLLPPMVADMLKEIEDLPDVVAEDQELIREVTPSLLPDLFQSVCVACSALSTHLEGSAIPPASERSFHWRTGLRRVPSAADLSSCPQSALADYLLKRLEALEDLPTAPPCGYDEVLAFMDGRHVTEVFPRLADLQRWCVSNGFFDLSAVVVNRHRQVPGRGHFGADCQDEEEWRRYVRNAIQSL